MYMQSLTQLPFDKFQHLTLGTSENIAVVQNHVCIWLPSGNGRKNQK